MSMTTELATQVVSKMSGPKTLARYGMRLPAAIAFMVLVLGAALPASAQFNRATFRTPDIGIFARRLPPPPEAFDYFEAEDAGHSVVNRFLLGHLSMNIYNNGVPNAFYDQQLREFYRSHGADDVTTFHDSDTGADGMILVTSDAVIVVFRGTASGENGSYADQFADLDNDIELIKVDDVEIGFHRGFWNAAYSVYPEVWTRVAVEAAAGKKVWLAGHSLGGATAVCTAFRLQYMDGIPVEGLMTFGAPRVGDGELYKAVEQGIAGGKPLIETTQRFVLDGDPGPTFFNVGYDYRKRSHAYFHFGRTHTIFSTESNGYVFDYDSGELEMDPIPVWELYDRLSTGIHMDYELALIQETTFWLSEWGHDQKLDTLLELVFQ